MGAFFSLTKRLESHNYTYMYPLRDLLCGSSATFLSFFEVFPGDLLLGFSFNTGDWGFMLLGWRFWFIENQTQYFGIWWCARNSSLDGTRIIKW